MSVESQPHVAAASDDLGCRGAGPDDRRQPVGRRSRWRAPARPAAFDPTFGAGGLATTPASYGGVTAQADGKIIALGEDVATDAKGDARLTRYNVDGSLDPSFGSGGTTHTDLGQNEGAIGCRVRCRSRPGRQQGARRWGVRRPPGRDGPSRPGLRVGWRVRGHLRTPGRGPRRGCDHPRRRLDRVRRLDGYLLRNSNRHEFSVFRFKPDGAVDLGFGVSGALSSPVSDAQNALAYAIAAGPDGSLTVWGDASDPPGGQPYIPGRLFVAHLSSTGTFGPDSGTGGISTFVLADQPRAPAGRVAVEPDGRPVLTGYFPDPLTTANRSFVLRLRAPRSAATVRASGLGVFASSVTGRQPRLAGWSPPWA